MSRNGREKVFRIRFRSDLGTKTKLVVGRLPPSFPKRTLRVTKVSQEELLGVGEFNHLPELLMQEFSAQPS